MKMSMVVRALRLGQKLLKFLRPLAECKLRNDELSAEATTQSEKNASLRRQLSECHISLATSESSVDALQGEVATLQEAMKPIPAPKISRWIDGEKVKTICKAAAPNCRLYISDTIHYGLITDEEMERFLREDKTDLEKYVVHKNDCDDRAWDLLGDLSQGAWAEIAAGFAWSNLHAFNVYINDQEQLMVIEPQTDKIMEYSPNMHKYYTPIFLMMI